MRRLAISVIGFLAAMPTMAADESSITDKIINLQRLGYLQGCLEASIGRDGIGAQAFINLQAAVCENKAATYAAYVTDIMANLPPPKCERRPEDGMPKLDGKCQP